MNSQDMNIIWDIVLGSVIFSLVVLILCVLVLWVKSVVISTETYTVLLNHSTSIPVASGGFLLRALNDADIAIPSGCAGAGTCGLCKVQLNDYHEKPTPSELARLTKLELKEGTRLACQIRIRENLEVRVSQNILAAHEWQCRVSSIRQLSTLIKEITLDIPDGERLDFQPGGYVQVTAPPYSLAFNSISVEAEFTEQWNKLDPAHLYAGASRPTTRAYSLANKTNEQTKAVLLVRLALPPAASYQEAPAGTVSSWLFTRQIGDLVTVGGPFGDFRLHASDREMVLIGGGVGMAPLRSILHQELESERKRRVSFYYGARSQWDMFYTDELSQLMKSNQRFSYQIALSEPSTELPWEGNTGFVHEILENHFLASHPTPDLCDYYLCGPPLMQKAVMTALDQAGVESDSIFADSFG